MKTNNYQYNMMLDVHDQFVKMLILPLNESVHCQAINLSQHLTTDSITRVKYWEKMSSSSQI